MEMPVGFMNICIEALEEALRRFGRPEIFNTDQGSQFTSTDFTGVLKAHGIKISLDGKGRCMDNIFIERLWRSLKYENVYLHAYASVAEARAGIGAWLHFYNEERLHQAHGYRTPRQIYDEQCPWTGGRLAAPNDAASPGPRAKSGNGGMLTGAPRPTGTSTRKNGSSWVSGWWTFDHATRAATRAPSRALPRWRVLWTN